MERLPLALEAFQRSYAKEPNIQNFNRFFEQNPSNVVTSVALLGRPAMSFLTAIGSGPIRANFAQDGTFSGALFSVSGDKLFKIDKDLTVTAIAGTIGGTQTPQMAGTALYLFIADGVYLQFLDGDGSHATGTLTLTGQPLDTETVTINGTVYTFKTTLSVAYDVLIGADMNESLDNLVAAINADPAVENIAYKSGTLENVYVFADSPNYTLHTMRIVARLGGTDGNAYTLADTLTNGSWSAATMAGGAADALSGIATPDDVGMVSLCVLGGYVFLAAAQSQRIYFIRPGKLYIDALDFFSAEALPDNIVSLKTVGDQFWAFGAESSQVFELTGDADLPARPIAGRAFSQGILEGTAALLQTTLNVVGSDDIVYSVSGGPRRISTNAIEELVRQARKLERDNP